MEALQITPMPAAPQGAAPAMSAETSSIMTTVTSSSDTFGSVLGESIMQEQIPEVVEQSVPIIFTSQPFDGLIVDLQLSELQPDAGTEMIQSENNQNVQFLAACMQSAMMMPVQPPAIMPLAASEGDSAAAMPVDLMLNKAAELPQTILAVEDGPAVNSAVPPDVTENQSAISKKPEVLPETLLDTKTDLQTVRQAGLTQNPVQTQGGIKKPEQTQIQPAVDPSQGVQQTEPDKISPTVSRNGGEQQPVEVFASKTDSVTVQKPVNPQDTQVRFATQPGVELSVASNSLSGEENSEFASDGDPASTDSGAAVAAKLKTGAASEAGKQEFQTVSQLQANSQSESNINGLNIGQHPITSKAQVETTEISQQPVVAEHLLRQVAEKITGHEFKKVDDQISLKLSPEHLGNLQMNVRMEDQRIRVEIVAEHRGVRDALLQQADELKETLARQNIKMDSFTVTTGSGGEMHRDANEWRQTASETSQKRVQQNGQGNAYGGSQLADSRIRYFAQQYQSTLDVRF